MLCVRPGAGAGWGHRCSWQVTQISCGPAGLSTLGTTGNGPLVAHVLHFIVQP